MTWKLNTYEYDALGRLISVKYPDGASQTYTYDAAGNRLVTVSTPSSLAGELTISVDSFCKKNLGDNSNAAMLVKLTNGEIVGWGDNTNGILANGIVTATNQPPQRILFDPNGPVPPASATVVDWTFTNSNLYVVYSNGWVYSAGQNAYGQLGTNEAITVERSYLKRIDTFISNGKSVIKVWAGGGKSTTDGGGCVYFQTSDLLLYGCGFNLSGNLGDGTTTNRSTPVLCANLPAAPVFVVDVQVVAAVANFSAYLTMSDHRVYVAGYNAQGQLGVGTVTNVTTGFAQALTTSGTANFVFLSVNGGANGASPAGNALGVDTNGDVWTTGYNGHGELGQGTTTNLNKFTKIAGLSNIAQAGLGGGFYGMAYAINNAGTFQTWGYNGQNNLFKNSTTTPQSSPGAATFVPGLVSKVFFPKSNALATNSQMFVLTSSGLIVYSGNDNGLLAIADAVHPGASFYLPLPHSILSGAENIVDVFPHGTVTTQRLFLLTDKGNMYCAGNNTDSVCTAGIASDVPATAVSCFKLNLVQLDN